MWLCAVNTGEEKINGLTYVNRALGEEKHIELAGMFVQIGLIPNTKWLNGILERNQIGEIIVDSVVLLKFLVSSLPGIDDCYPNCTW